MAAIRRQGGSIQHVARSCSRVWACGQNLSATTAVQKYTLRSTSKSRSMVDCCKIRRVLRRMLHIHGTLA
eukprot:731436-Prymnesium_polylepis.3